ncbi:MAG: Tex-like N-terminal domain-containing protein [Gemmataceae bacterium]
MTTSTSPAPLALDLSRIAQDLQIRKMHVENVVQMLDEGNTVPFITRYRKERTGGMNEDVIRRIQNRVGQMRHLAERKQTVLKSIENQGKLTDDLRAAVLAAESPKRLEDLYLPYKPKKRSLASDAREKGLEPLAMSIWARDPAVANLSELLPTMLNPEKQLNSAEDILTGVKNILAELISELAELRGAVRIVVWDTGLIVSKRNEAMPENKGQEYKVYFDFKESVQVIPPHRILAINRGEKEEALRVKVEYDLDRVMAAANATVPLGDHPHRDLLHVVLEDALARLLLPSLEREVRRELTDFAQEHAVQIFARNLRSLLLQPPLRGKRILGIDPGLRTGCKLAALDETGTMLEHAVVYPHQPQNKRDEAKLRLEEMIRKHQLSVIAIGNGTACRETERLASELITDLEARNHGEIPPAPPAPPAPKLDTRHETRDAGIAPTAAPATESAPAAETSPAPEPVPPTPPSPVPDPTPEPIGAPNPEPLPTPEPAAAPEVGTAETAVAHDSPPPETVTAAAPTVSDPAPAESTSAFAVAAPAPNAEAPQPAPVVEVPPPAPPALPSAPELPKFDFSGLPLAPADLAYVIVNEAGASDYSASQIAKEEFPDFDATVRSTVSIGRRLQDPLSELVKIDPQHVGVGLYQHDVKPRNLKESLEAVIESCVNHVGVDLNTASVPLLRHVSGLNQMVARDLVEHRKQHGPFKSREQLLAVNGVGPARYTQAAGFLKIGGGDEPLDETWIHPESYLVAREILKDAGLEPADLRDKAKLDQLRESLNKIHAEVYADRLKAGLPTVKDIFDALARPSRDPREDLPPPVFRKNILKIEDLQPGMELKGTVLNVVDFGAFVDIGLKDSGLVHISQMANRYIKNPYEVAAVGDVVTVWVRSVDMERRHVALTMIAPGTERKPPERRQGPPPQREPREPRPQRQGPPPQRQHQPQGQGQGQGPPQDRSGPPRGRGGPPRGRGFRRGGPPPGGPQQPQPAPHGEGQPAPTGQGSPPQRQPSRRPEKPRVLPKLSPAALKGKTPLHSFGELEAFFKQKDEPAVVPTPAPAPPPPAEAPAVAPPAE